MAKGRRQDPLAGRAEGDGLNPGAFAPAADAEPAAKAQITRVAWLHLANDFTLDFLTPLLPQGVGVAWIGLMEGLADAVGQGLKLFTGRASDRSGRRAAWVAGGYLVNAIARPLTAVGMLLSLPWWIMGCRVADRIGKGVRGSATDALVADWTDGQPEHVRAGAFSRMRTMDHIGATLGGLAAALAAWAIAPGHLWVAVAALAVATFVVAWIASGLRDRPEAGPKAAGPAPGWWPSGGRLQWSMLLVGLGTVAKLSPLLVLVHVAGSDGAQRWELWQICLGWAALGLVQTVSALLAEGLTARLGVVGMLRFSWLAGAAVLASLAFAEGPWLIAAGLAFGIQAGMSEGAEKSWVASLAAKSERATAFGALALVGAGAVLVGNGGGGWLLAVWGPEIFLVLAGLCLVAVAGTLRSPEAAH